MKNLELVSRHLLDQGLYPYENLETQSDGLKISVQKRELTLAGNSADLIELADLLVSLALSGENTGQHWHVDSNGISINSDITEMIISLKE